MNLNNEIIVSFSNDTHNFDKSQKSNVREIP